MARIIFYHHYDRVACVNEPYLIGGPGLINIDNHGCTLVEVFNSGPEPILLEPIARWKRPCKNWLPILMRGRLLEKLQCGHCKIWKPSFLLFSAGCTSLIVYLPSDRSSVMSATMTEATNASNLTLKRASQKLGLATPYRLLSSWWPSFKHGSTRMIFCLFPHWTLTSPHLLWTILW